MHELSGRTSISPVNSFFDGPDGDPQPDPRWSIIRYERHMRDVMRMGALARQCVREWQSGKSLTGDSLADVSLCYLMLRMICESMVLASVMVHDAFLGTLRKRIVRKQWNAGRIVKEIERVNPEWYPIPVIVTHVDPDPEDHIPPCDYEIDRLPRGGWLTQAEFTKLYSTCNAYLHARGRGR